jgi:hypothetical protein
VGWTGCFVSQALSESGQFSEVSHAWLVHRASMLLKGYFLKNVDEQERAAASQHWKRRSLFVRHLR